MLPVLVVIGACLTSLGCSLLIRPDDYHHLAWPCYFTGLTLIAVVSFADGHPVTGTVLGAAIAVVAWLWWNDEDQRRRRRKLRDAAMARIINLGATLTVVRPAPATPSQYTAQVSHA